MRHRRVYCGDLAYAGTALPLIEMAGTKPAMTQA
jgi:hypothetical protein